jgi:light-regulated signal transduction histidine kinase (bacteriophytochrome)
LVAQAAQEGGLATMTDGQPTLLDGMAAGGAALYHLDRWWRVGNTPSEPELEALGEWLNDRPEFASPTRPLYATDALARDYPPASAFASVASGLLVSRAERLADLNADLTRSNEELDAFAYVASHDLKEPLRGIYKYAHQLLEDAAVADEQNRKKLEGLMRLTVRMDSLLDSLLYFSRVGRETLLTEVTDLNEVVAEAVEMVDARRTEGPTEIVIPRPLPNIRCDRVRCREIFVNLLSNALKYNDKPQKRVEVGFIAPSEDHRRPGFPEGVSGLPIYYVKDNGIGIPVRHFEQVFKMFKRLHGRDEFGGGTGAGLTIVQKLVERHHGRVWLESTPGTGTTFYFTLSCREGV